MDLVHKIEKLVGHKLLEYDMDEKLVLKNITKVYKARRTATMRMSEEETREELKGKVKRKRKAHVNADL